MPTLYVTAPDDAAEEIANTLVDERLAACVNLVDCQSIYRWDGQVHDEQERILLVKTTAGAAAAAVDRIEAIHPYDVPCIETFDEASIAEPFEAWIDDAVSK